MESEGLGGGMLLPHTIIWMLGKEKHQSDFLVEGKENCHWKRLSKRAAVEWLKAPGHMGFSLCLQYTMIAGCRQAVVCIACS